MNERIASLTLLAGGVHQVDAERALAAIAAARQALDQAERALVEALPSLVAAATPLMAAAPEWVTMGKASQIMRCSMETATKHVVDNGLGVKRVGSQWRVDLVRVRAWREGDPYERLIPYPTE